MIALYDESDSGFLVLLSLTMCEASGGILIAGARQIFEIKVDMVQTSCGMAVPFMDYNRERDELNKWADKKGEEGIRKYWKERNTESPDGLTTGILEQNADL